MIKKWNAVCSWMLTLFLLGHMLTMSIPVLTGGQDYSDCQILAGGIVATVLIHVVFCIVSYYPRRGVLNFHRYRKENWRLITQRISGIVILILLYPHMRVLHLIISGASFSGGAKFLVLVTEILFAGAAFLHLSVSFSRSMLTLGLLKNDRMEKLVDYVTWIICGLLMVLTVAARISEIFRKEKMTNEGIDYRKWNCRDVCCNRSSRT